MNAPLLRDVMMSCVYMSYIVVNELSPRLVFIVLVIIKHSAEDHHGEMLDVSYIFSFKRLTVFLVLYSTTLSYTISIKYLH